MRPVTLYQTGVGATDPCPMDLRLVPFNAALQVAYVAEESPSPEPIPSPSPSPGGTSYVVETTDSDIWGPADELLWTLHPSFEESGVEVPKFDNWVGNLAFPATAVRLRVVDGDATLQLRVVQSGH